MKIEKFEAIVFDFGNVIIDIEFENLFNGFAESSGKSVETIKSRFEDSQIIRKYESGFFEEDEFYEAIRQIVGYPYSDNEIVTIWNSLLLDIPTERMELIHRVRNKFTIALLSNTNEIHIKACSKIFKSKFDLSSINSAFDKTYLSYELGLWKPEPAIYQHVINDLQLPPNKILFFDDNPQNVESALNMGIQAIQVSDNYGIIDFFNEYPHFQ